MKRKNILRALLILSVGIVISLIDTKYYVYSYHRVLEGNKFSRFDAKLSSGFYFYEKNEKERSYVVFHRDLDSIALFVFADKKPDFSDFLNKGLVTLIQDFNGCKVYRGTGKIKKTYIDFDKAEIINAVVGADDVSKENLKTLCGML